MKLWMGGLLRTCWSMGKPLINTWSVQSHFLPTLAPALAHEDREMTNTTSAFLDCFKEIPCSWQTRACHRRQQRHKTRCTDYLGGRAWASGQEWIFPLQKSQRERWYAIIITATDYDASFCTKHFINVIFNPCPKQGCKFVLLSPFCKCKKHWRLATLTHKQEATSSYAGMKFRFTFWASTLHCCLWQPSESLSFSVVKIQTWTVLDPLPQHFFFLLELEVAATGE